MSVHFQFSHSKFNQDLQTLYFRILNLQIGFDIYIYIFFFQQRGNVFLNELNWKWGENSPAFKSAETTNNKKPKLLILRANCHSSTRIWTDNCEISISRKLQFMENLLRKHICLCLILPLRGLGRFCDLIPPPPALLLEPKLIHSYWRHPSQKNDRSQWKSASYCSLGNSKTRAVYSLHGIDY